ncbi:MAG: hypothetical protein AAGA12_06310 [Pseudomonadota bacterium]
MSYHAQRFGFSRNLLFSSFLLVLSLPVLARLWWDLRGGGDPWRQGDWLVNFGSGPIRRGWFGESIIWMSDALSVPLLHVTIALQMGLLGLLIALIACIWWFHDNQRLVFFLLASPAFFMFQWAGDMQTIMRKEILGYLAISFLLFAAIAPRGHFLAAFMGLVFFTLGCIGNTLHSLKILPFLIGIYFLFLQGRLSRAQGLVLAGIAAFMSVFWMGYSLQFNEVAELSGMCAKLVSRGMESSICDGAIRWLVTDEVNHGQQVAALINRESVMRYSMVSALAAVPAIAAYWMFREKLIVTTLIVVAVVPIIPLYVVTTDWGRWLSIIYTSLIFLILQAHAAKKLTLVQQPHIAVVSFMFFAAIMVTPHGTLGNPNGNVIASLFEAITAFL